MKEKEENLRDNEELVNYEKIANLTYRFDKYIGKSVTFSLLFIGLVLLFSYMLIYGKREPGDELFYELIIPLSINILLIFFLLFLIFVIIFFFASLFNDNRKYNIQKILRLLFYELSENPEEKRKEEIIRHLSYNLQKLGKNIFRPTGFGVLIHYNWRTYFKIYKDKNLLNLKIINDIIDLIHDYHLYSFNIERIYFRDIGNYLENFQFIEISKILIKIKNRFNDIKKITEFPKKNKKERLGNIKIKVEWVSKIGKDLVYIFVSLLILWYLLSQGVIPPIPFP